MEKSMIKRKIWKKNCAALLCAILIINNPANTVIAADSKNEVEFELGREALYEAIQKAVQHAPVNKEFEFCGEEAELYHDLINESGELYELKPEFKSTINGLNLRIFARLDGEIPILEDTAPETEDEYMQNAAYEIDGDEDIIFLLTNTSNEKKTAIIYVDDRATESIVVVQEREIVAGSKVEQELQTGSILEEIPQAASPGGGSGKGRAFDPTAELDMYETEDPAEILVLDKTDSETDELNKEVEDDCHDEDDIDATENTSDRIEDPRTEDMTDDADDKSDDGSSEDDDNSADDGSSEDGDNSADDGSSEDGDNSADDGNSEDRDNGSDDENSEDRDNGFEDDNSENSDSSAGDTLAAAISYHPVYRVTAAETETSTPIKTCIPALSDATPSDATSSDASLSDTDTDLIDGILYDAVLLDDASAVAFVTSAAVLELDDLNQAQLQPAQLQPATPADADYEYSAAIDGFAVYAYANKGVLPKNATLQVTELKKDDTETETQYQEAKQALDNQGTQYDGMIALDISFLDENDEPIEPNNDIGNVQVRIEMETSKLPEGVDTTSLEVKHLDESATEPEAITVADATDKTEGSVVLQEQKNVITAEFEVGSFSCFVITYNSSSIGTVYIVNPDGAEIKYRQLNNFVSENYSWMIGEWTWIGYVVNSIIVKNNPDVLTNCTYSKAIAGGNSFDDPMNETIYWIKVMNGNLYYSTHADGTERDNSEAKLLNGNIYLIFGEPIETVETVDSIAKGITITMFDYDADSKDTTSWGQTIYGDASKGINTGHPFRFMSSQWSNCNNLALDGLQVNLFNGTGSFIDGKNGGIAPMQGIVKPDLNGGYPELFNGSSLAYLFDSEESNYKTVKTDANHLFLQDWYDNGYFYYNSSENYATLADDNDSDFTVYARPADEDCKFMPYNPLIDTQGKLEISETKDYHFGMEIEFDFRQPENGIIDDEPMVFEFNGDDDMWVFIDDKLVLDIGGVHQPVGGEINFRTGQITVNKILADGKSKTGGTVEDTETSEQITYLKDIFSLNEDTFLDHTEHTMKIFYLERGAGDSNCKIKFNIPPIPPGTVSIPVAKTLEAPERTSKEKANESVTDVRFELLEADENWKPKQENEPVDTQEMDKVKSYVKEVGADGIALFEDIPVGYYLLREISTAPGYNKLADEIGIKVELINKTTGEVDYTIWMKEKPEGQDNQEEPEKSSWKQVTSSTNKFIVLETYTVDGIDGNIRVINTMGSVLPETGGPGIEYFKDFGWVLILLSILMTGWQLSTAAVKKCRKEEEYTATD